VIGQEAHDAAKANHSSLSLVSLLLKLSPLNLVPGALVRCPCLLLSNSRFFSLANNF
jgi:hypothetical protein